MHLLWAGFIMGLAGSLHCVLMCGPLVLSAQTDPYGKVLYQAGRIISYLIIGVIFGALGKLISIFFYQQVLSVVSGSLLLVWVFFALFPGTSGFGSVVLRLWSKSTSGLWQKVRSGNRFATALGMGVLNGFLPCGLVYMAAIASLNQGNIGYSLTFMTLFGLGTLPAMLAIAYSGKLVPLKWRFSIRKLSPVLLALLGLLFIVRGLNLDIPYLSAHISQKTNNTAAIPTCGMKADVVKK